MPDRFKIPNPMTRGERVEGRGTVTEIRRGTVKVKQAPISGGEVKTDRAQYVAVTMEPDGSRGRSRRPIPAADPLVHGAPPDPERVKAEQAAVKAAREDGERLRAERLRRRLGLDV